MGESLIFYPIHPKKYRNEFSTSEKLLTRPPLHHLHSPAMQNPGQE